MSTFREILLNEESKIIFKGSKATVDKIMDKLQDYEEKHKFPYQGYGSYTKDYKTYVIEVKNTKEYEKHKSWMDKIVK